MEKNKIAITFWWRWIASIHIVYRNHFITVRDFGFHRPCGIIFKWKCSPHGLFLCSFSHEFCSTSVASNWKNNPSARLIKSIRMVIFIIILNGKPLCIFVRMEISERGYVPSTPALFYAQNKLCGDDSYIVPAHCTGLNGASAQRYVPAT